MACPANRADTLAVKALLTNLSRGEAEVIILAGELSCDYALIDEKLARNIATLLGINTVGVLGVMNMAIVAGIPIQKQQALDTLRRVGFRISDKRYQQMLQSYVLRQSTILFYMQFV